MKVAIVLNAAAGSLLGQSMDEVRARVGRLFGEEGHDARVDAGTGPEIVPLIRAATDSDVDVVVVGGGDGTVASAANMLLDTDKALGILPLGTLNLYAKDLATPLGIDDAASAVARGRVMSMDVGEVNGRLFLNHSVLGLYPRIVQEREETREHLGLRRWKVSKWPAMAVAAFHALRTYPMLSVTLVTAEGRRRHFLTPALAVANNAYDEGFGAFLKRSRLDTGSLALYVSKHRSAWGIARLMLKLPLGSWTADDDLEVLRLREFTVTTMRRRIRVANDGEVESMDTPLRYRIRPGALKVLVPETYAAAGDEAASPGLQPPPIRRPA